jgi:hypothetical protein
MIRRISCFFVLALSCCAPPAPPIELGPVSQADFDAWSGSGPADIKGQAFLTTVGGDVKTCAGNQVFLMPANDYDISLDNALMKTKNVNANTNLVAQNVRVAMCDSQGNFEVSSLPSQSWIIGTEVQWGVPNEYGSITYEGGYLKKIFNLNSGTNKIILSNSDLQ